MKRIGRILLILMFIPIAGFDELEELLEQEIENPITFAGDLEIVSETAVGEPTDPITVQTELSTYHINADPDVRDLLDGDGEITKVKIERIRYTYKDFEGNTDAFVIEGGFSFANASTISICVYPLRDTNISVSEADFRYDAFILEDDFSALEAGLTNIPSIIIAYFVPSRIIR